MRSRWERLNGVCLCWQHHKQFAHGDAPGFLSWLRVASPDRYEFALDPFRTEPIQRPIGDIIDIAVSLELDNKLYEAEAA